VANKSVGKCPTHQEQLVQRDEKRLTPEQRFSGTWYDCPLCYHSVLEPSPELVRQMEETKNKPKQAVLAV
jgi:hypothetical protein